MEDYDSDIGELRILRAKGRKQRLVYVANGTAAALANWLAIQGDQARLMLYQIRRDGHIKLGRLTTQTIYYILQNRVEQARLTSLTLTNLGTALWVTYWVLEWTSPRSNKWPVTPP